MEKLNKLVSLQIKEKALGLQDNLWKQEFHDDMKEIFEPVTKSIKDVCENVTKTLMVTSEEHNNTLVNVNSKLLYIVQDRGLLSTYLLSSLQLLTPNTKADLNW